MQQSRTSTAAHDVWMRFVADQLAGEPVDFERLCATHAELRDELCELRARWMAPREPPVSVAPAAAREPLDALLKRLATPSTRAGRYRIDGEIARGGMGVVHRVWDLDLQRPLALKLLRALPGAADRRALRRFVEEAQIIARLDHPAIVPVHDIGVDEFGRPFFVMKLVEGDELRRIFELAWARRDGWSPTRVVGVLLKVAEAVGYAHERGVVHRDLKPSNVMVGRFGEVYAMDWGVARVLKELGVDPRAEHSSTAEEVAPAARIELGGADDALVTADGDVIGTAAYMSPEQARGEVAELTPRSDVYAFGALLYHLLAQRMPYEGDRLTSAQLLARVRAGPPPKLARLEPHTAPELVSICEKAMARAPEQRYANLTECATDLRAFLEGRVVRAHRTDAWVVVTKWIRRNRALSASLVAALALAAGGLWTVRRAAEARENLELLSHLRQPTELLVEYELLWPPIPARLPALESWLSAAEQVAAHIEDYRAQLEELRRHAQPWDPTAALERSAQLELDARRERGRRLIEHLETQRRLLIESGAKQSFDGMTVAEIDAQLALDGPTVEERFREQIRRRTWTFAEAADQLLHDRLAALIPDVERLAVSPLGYSPIERVRRACEYLRREARAGSEVSEARRAAWAEARASIRDMRQCAAYRGLELAPQAGLVPIGRDPRSGLWEFAHLASGSVARRAENGELTLKEETGIVLVLLPGSECLQGTQNTSPEGTNFDPWHEPMEGPLTAVLLDPFFVSKYEMTQAQWERWTGRQPSSQSQARAGETWRSATQPVEWIPWRTCASTLRELGFRLPTEAQWEYAARGGTQTPWSDPRGLEALASCANLRDSAWESALPRGADPAAEEGTLEELQANDGFSGSAPVGSLAPNGFGLHDVHGNVAEWVGDVGALSFATPRWIGSGERATQGDDERGRVARGGSYTSSPLEARVGARLFLGDGTARGDVGVRPVRAIEP